MDYHELVATKIIAPSIIGGFPRIAMPNLKLFTLAFYLLNEDNSSPGVDLVDASADLSRQGKNVRIR